MSNDSTYTLADFGWMIDSQPRTTPYAQALRQAVTPGCRVIDIGAGAGIFSMIACQLGAGSVVAIDPNPCIHLVGPIAEANGFGDRISVFKGFSTEYRGEPADVVVSDLRGIMPLFEAHVPSIKDARTRLLVPDGRLIPARDQLRVAIATAPQAYRRYDSPWLVNRYGIDLSAGRRFLVNTYQKVTLGPDALLSDVSDLKELDYRSIEDPNLDEEFDLEISSRGTAHGLLLWFDAELADGIGFSNAPGQPPAIYGQTLFPFERPVDLEIGDRVTGKISALLIDGTYIWNWAGGFKRAGRSLGADFQQSSFLSKIFDPDALEARSADKIPVKAPLSEAAIACLELVDGRRSLNDIATQLAERYPMHFDTRVAALDFAARMTAREL